MRAVNQHLSLGVDHVEAVTGSLAFMAVALAAPSHATAGFRDREDPAVVREWNVLAEGVIPASAGPTLPRPYAMMHIAMFDAVNSIEGGYTAVSHARPPLERHLERSCRRAGRARCVDRTASRPARRSSMRR